jgi:hypothetical protein
MNYVAHNPNLSACEDCGREYHEEHGSVIHAGLDVWCAKKRIEAEQAEKARSFRDLSRDWFKPWFVALPGAQQPSLTQRVVDELLARVPVALANARQLLEQSRVAS